MKMMGVTRSGGKEKDEERELIAFLPCGDCLWKSQLSVPFLSQSPLQFTLLLITHITKAQLPPA